MGARKVLKSRFEKMKEHLRGRVPVAILLLGLSFAAVAICWTVMSRSRVVETPAQPSIANAQSAPDAVAPASNGEPLGPAVVATDGNNAADAATPAIDGKPAIPTDPAVAAANRNDNPPRHITRNGGDAIEDTSIVGYDKSWKREIANRRRALPNGDTEITRLVELKEGKYPLQRVVDVIKKDAVTGKQTVSQRTEMVADHLMVKLAGQANEAELTKLAVAMGGEIRRKMNAPGLYLVKIPAKRIDDFELSMAALNQAPGVVRYAEPDHIAHTLAVPDDSRYPDLWSMDNTGQTGGKTTYDPTGAGVVDADIDAPEAWDITTGSRDILVGVIDTGIDYTHPDLAANIWTNPGESGLDGSGNDKRSNGIDDDGNGYVDDWRGWDFINEDNDPLDGDSHGTHCAGTIGAVGNNSVGVTGICWNVSLVGLKIFTDSGYSNVSAIVEAVYYATIIGVDLTSNSYGIGGFSQAMSDAVADARDHKILFVAAASNDGTDNDVIPQYPASFAHDNIISVAATNRKDALAGFSCYGLTSVDVGAPGVGILSTIPGNQYAYYDGTSMATPLVAGACALVKSYRPQLTYLDIKNAIMDSTDKLPALSGKCVTGGRINVYKMLHEVTSLKVTSGRFVESAVGGASGNGDGLFNPGERIGYYPTIKNFAPVDATGVTVQASVPTNPYVTVANGLLTVGTLATNAELETPEPFLINLAAGMPTPYSVTLTITASDASGWTYSKNVPMKIYTSSTITGTVTMDGAPLAGARIDYQGTPYSGTLMSAADGTYGILQGNGACSLSVSYGDYSPMSTSVTLPPSKTVNFAFVTASISGTITDGFTNVPIAGATIAYAGSVSGSVESDANGNYSFSHVFPKAETLNLTVSASGYLTETRSVTVPPSAGNVNFALGFSDIEATPTSLAASAMRGEVVQRSLTIANKHTKPLIWRAQTDYEFYEAPYDWIDISQTGTSVPIPWNAARTMKGPQNLGFSMPFYDRYYDALYVSKFGLMSFDPTASENYMVPKKFPPLGSPSSHYKKSMLGLFWAELFYEDSDFWNLLPESYRGTMHVQQVDPTTFIFQMDRTEYSSSITWNYEDGTEFTLYPHAKAQAILRADGTIRYQYKDAVFLWDPIAVGIQNHNGTKGVTHLYQTDLFYPDTSQGANFPAEFSDAKDRIRSGSAWEIARQLPEWVTITSAKNGTLNYNESTTLTLEFDAGRAPIGVNTYKLGIHSNDPDEPRIEIPITFTVAPAPVPGTIEAEQYNEGLVADTYYDTTANNAGGQYRTDDVDISGSAGEYYVTNTATGEWLNYTVNVAADGAYDIELRVAAAAAGGQVRVEFDGVDKTGPISIPATGGAFSTVGGYNVPLTAGQHIMRVHAITGGFNLDKVVVFPSEPNVAPVITDVTATPNPVTLSVPSVPWGPDPDDLAAWFDVKDPNSIVFEPGSTTAVKQWSDKSRNGRHLTQTNTSAQPTLGVDEIQMPVNKYMLSGDGLMPSGSGGRHVFAVVNNTTTTNVGFISQSHGNWNARNGFVITGEPAVRYNGAMTYNGGALSASDNLIAVSYNSGSNVSTMRFAVNGSQRVGTISSGDGALASNGTKLYVGCNHLGSLKTSEGAADFRELIILTDAALSVDTQQRIEGYLAWKWGLEGNLPTDHPYHANNNGQPIVPGTGATVTLSGSVQDPNRAKPTTTWSVVSTQPAGLSVNFANAASPVTTARFSTLGTYTLRLTADDGVAAPVSEDVVVMVTDGSAVGYNLWATGNFAKPFTDTAMSSNPDGDRRNNMMEFAFGTDPTIIDMGPLSTDGSKRGDPVAAKEQGGGFALYYIRRTDHGNTGSVIYSTHFSPDLTTFEPSSVGLEVVGSAGAGYELVKVPFPTGSRFGYVKIEAAP